MTGNTPAARKRFLRLVFVHLALSCSQSIVHLSLSGETHSQWRHCRHSGANATPQYVLGHFFLGLIYVAEAKYDKAIPELERAAAASNNGGALAGLAYGKAMAGERDRAWELLAVPTITLEGDANGAPHPDPSSYAKKFSGKYVHRLINGGIGHNLPQEAPQAFAEAVVEVDGYVT